MVHGPGGMVKVVAEAGDGRALGVRLVGPHVSEMAAGSRLIVGWEAAPADVARHVRPHPTLAEAAGEAFLTPPGADCASSERRGPPPGLTGAGNPDGTHGRDRCR
jgi:dihydrolipoamide dehydrogenase